MSYLGACALEYNSVMPLVGGRSLHPRNCKRRNQFLIKGKRYAWGRVERLEKDMHWNSKF